MVKWSTGITNIPILILFKAIVKPTDRLNFAFCCKGNIVFETTNGIGDNFYFMRAGTYFSGGKPLIWETQIAPGISAGNTLVWASGYNVGFGLIDLPHDVDVVLVAPRMTGNFVRTLYEKGKGTVAQVAVHQDASGEAWARMMAIAKGIGATRAGVFESSFREEAELDLFAEQVVWAGLVAWFEECFKLGVEHGFSPELMVLELYGSGEAAEILGMMAQNGFYRQMAHHSTTSQYGTLSRAQYLLNDEIKEKMRGSLVNDIKGGEFVQEWSREQATGSQTLTRLKDKASHSAMSQAEETVLSLMQLSGDF